MLSVTLEGRDAYCNACGIDAAQVQVTCQPKAALQHVDVQPGSSDTAVSIHAKAVAQGVYQASSTSLCTAVRYI